MHVRESTQHRLFQLCMLGDKIVIVDWGRNQIEDSAGRAARKCGRGESFGGKKEFLGRWLSLPLLRGDGERQY